MTRKGPEGSNPSPGAYFEEPGTSLKGLAGESREETTNMDGPTANKTIQTTIGEADGASSTIKSPTLSTIPSQLGGVIDSITHGMSRKALNTRLKMLYRISPSNAATICEHILSKQTERNIKISTAENKVNALLWLTRYLKLKPFEQMTKQDILSYLSSLRKSPEVDPQHKWIGSYNNRLRVYIRFFKWFYNKDESDHRKRIILPCIQGLRQLPRQDKSPYKPTDLWDNREHTIKCYDPLLKNHS